MSDRDCRFHARHRVLSREPDDPQTGTIAHLRVWLVGKNALEQSRRVRPDVGGPGFFIAAGPILVC